MPLISVGKSKKVMFHRTMPSQKTDKGEGKRTPEQSAGPSDAPEACDTPADASPSEQPTHNKLSTSKEIPPSQFYHSGRIEKSPEKPERARKRYIQRVGRIAPANEDIFGFDETSSSDSNITLESNPEVMEEGNDEEGGEAGEEGEGGEEENEEEDDDEEALSMDEDAFQEPSDPFEDDSDIYEDLNDRFEYTDGDTDDEEDDDSTAPFDLSMEFFSDVPDEDSSNEDGDLPEDGFERELLGSTMEPGRSLHMSVIKGDSRSLVRWKAWGTGVWARKVKGDTELHCAARSGDMATVEQLIQAGAKLSEINRKRHTPLEVAALCGHVAVVQTLLKHGAGTDTEQMEHALLATKSSAVVRVLAQENQTLLLGITGVDVLSRAARDGRVLMLRALLKGGADANWPGTFSRTALHTAASRGHVRCVSALLEYQADVTSVDDRLWTPLHYAAHHSHHECVRVLLAAGADPNAKSGEGQIPYDVAFDEAIHRLLENA
ncbi:hypothetical protein R5R35_002378 [Gryllus longicercus]|uniref:Uncharacterized protein n=2 Tax=Gryllus longicercus TaxID=2509291 RepID=A0AAN9V0I3_9ORTH